MAKWQITLIASAIGTGVGFWAWALNLTKLVWPAHPQLAGFLLTVVSAIIIELVWPNKQKTPSRT